MTTPSTTPGHRPDPPNRRARRLRAGAAVLALAVAPLVLPRTFHASAGAEEIRNGTARAVATVGRYSPGVGELQLGVTNGVAAAEVTNSLAQARSQAANLGLVGDSLAAESCSGGDAAIEKDQLPHATTVDNRQGDASVTRDEMRTDGAPFGGGRMTSSATKEVPTAEALVDEVGVELEPVLQIGGGSSRAAAAVLPGKGRQAEATVRSSLNIGGLLELSGMRWHALHRTGTERLVEGTFEVGHAEIGGVPFPTDDLAALEAAANQLLELSGLSISFPRIVQLTEPTDLVRVSPMRLEVRDTPVGKTVLGPVLVLTREQRSQLFDTMVEQFCQAAGAFLVGDIVLSVLAGTGFFTVDLGGVEASSADLELFNPFGSIGPGLSPGALGPLPPSIGTPTGGGGGSAGGSVTRVIPGTPAGTPQNIPTPTVPAASRGPIETVCESLHPNGDSCSTGTAAMVGLLGLLGTVGLVGAEYARFRRRRIVEA